MLSSLLGVRIRSQLFAVCPLEPGVNFSFRTNLVVALLASFLGQGGEVQTTDMLLDYLATWLMDPFVHNHNDGHHHHGQDVQAVLGEGPASHQEEDSWLHLPSTNSKHEEELFV